MLDTRPIDDTTFLDETTLRFHALVDRVTATPIGANAHVLQVLLVECDVLERSLLDPSAICRLRNARHWLRLSYGTALHGYPPEELRRHTLQALMRIRNTPLRNA